ncbi:YtxH domain-containing protein [Clostridium tarantellae]|uniref:YtxH domain-containing protein n=1 Tax=Clostridium tarantellae TaxID=39493 RepID=A0A6I1MYS3_9CLOT|nr:YtxH domain-containing protein [Clostridium tarantellae]MPQ45269.1 YtxH domain-containing protein [Clostridium tarantellae]
MGLYKLIEKKKKAARRKQKAKVAKYATLTAVIGAIGVTSGVLFAPKSGKETRNDIAEKAKKVKGHAKEKAKSIKENLNEKVNDKKEEVKVAKEKISEYLAQKKHKKSEKPSIELLNDNEAIENKNIHENVKNDEEVVKE